MRRDHIRYALIALALALMAVSASLALGLRNAPDIPMWAICEDLGYSATDSDLARCGDHLGLACGSPYTDHLRETC